MQQSRFPESTFHRDHSRNEAALAHQNMLIYVAQAGGISRNWVEWTLFSQEKGIEKVNGPLTFVVSIFQKNFSEEATASRRRCFMQKLVEKVGALLFSSAVNAEALLTSHLPGFYFYFLLLSPRRKTNRDLRPQMLWRY